MSTIATVNDPRFSASATRDGTEIMVRLIGEADTNAKRGLQPFLDAVHGAAASSPGATVVVDLKALKFMNSSCFQDFVMWLGRVREADRTEQYKIAFLSSAEQQWQRRSLSALGCFAPDQVTIK